MEWKNKIKNPNLEQIGRLIITLSVMYKSVIIEINGKKYELKGMWEGKNIWNWNQERAYFKEIT